MSDTPRTEAEVKFGLSYPLAGVVTVCADFACRLERELNAAQAAIRQQQLLDEEIMRLRERVKRLEEAAHAVYLDSIALDHPWTELETRNMRALRDVLETKP